MNNHRSRLILTSLGIDTYTEPVIYMHKDCHICRSEGFRVQTRVRIFLKERSLIATINIVQSELLQPHEASLSTYAWEFLRAKVGDEITVTHPDMVVSLSDIRSKVYDHPLSAIAMERIVNDLVTGQLSDIHIAMFLAATAGKRLDQNEILYLTQSMVHSGQRLSWPDSLVVDKHCIGGLPGNRTTLIIVPIVAAFGLMMPKTSSRAITSPSGTADTMEVFAPVNLNLKEMQRVIEKEHACIVWGGSVSLSPADDLLIRIERSMDLDSEGQMVASILSKKISAGSNHLVIDMPIGPTAKVRSLAQAEAIQKALKHVAEQFSIQLRIVLSDGTQPVGRGIGPVLEARDVLAVLQNRPDAPQDLRAHALTLAGHILEFSPQVAAGEGKSIAETLLTNGRALQKFEAICCAQGGMFDLPKATHTHTITALRAGVVTAIDNRHLAQLAKLAGAPAYKASGVEVLVKIGMRVEKDQPLFVVHAEAPGELTYALSFLQQGREVLTIADSMDTV